VCGKHEFYDEQSERRHDLEETVVRLSPQTQRNPGDGTAPVKVGETPRAGLPDRGLTKDTLDAYGVTLGYEADGKVSKHYYPYTKSGTVVGTKVRIVANKEFYSSGTIRDAELFGQNILPPGGKFITLVEGEIDAMSVYQMTGHPAVSVRGASSAVMDCKQNHAYIDTFETIVIAFDNDTPKAMPDGTVILPGQEAAEKVAKLFKPGKVKIMSFSQGLKDANDYLMAGKKEAWERAFWRARTYSVAGILPGTELYDDVMRDVTYDSVPYMFTGMNQKLYGLRTHEMVTLTAGTGMGKTTLLKFLAVHLKNSTPAGSNIGMIMLEESTRETALGLMSMSAHTPFHLPDARWTPEQKKQAFEDTLGSGRFFIHENEHFDSSTVDGILSQIRTMVSAYDCKYIILDHVSIVVSDQTHGDERRTLDELATKIKRLTMELGICIIIVCHLKRVGGTAAEEGGQVSLSDLRGTAGIGQLSNVVIALERDGQNPDPGVAKRTRIRVLKNRFCGRLGVACEIEFDDITYSYVELGQQDQTTTTNQRETL
jgi:twinkle protein